MSSENSRAAGCGGWSRQSSRASRNLDTGVLVMRSALVFLAIVLVSVPVIAQQGGSKGQTHSRSSGSRGTTPPRVSADEPVATFEGTVTGIQHKKILVDDAEGNTMDFYTTKKTRTF